MEFYPVTLLKDLDINSFFSISKGMLLLHQTQWQTGFIRAGV